MYDARFEIFMDHKNLKYVFTQRLEPEAVQVGRIHEGL